MSSSTSARALKWEFFLTRWQQAYEVVSGALGNAAAAAAGAPRLAPHEAARLDILLLKAERARSALAQLREFDARHGQIVARYGALAESLPEVRRRLRDEELHRAAEYASRGGGGPAEPLAAAMRMLSSSPSEYASGGAAAASGAGAGATAAAAPPPVSEATPAGRADPFGIRVGFRAEHPLGVMRSWAEYRAAFSRISEAAGDLLQGPPLERLAAFNLERRALLAEAASLRRQLAEAGACSASSADSPAAAAAAAASSSPVDGSEDPGSSSPPPPALPDLAAVERDCDAAEALAAALRRVRAAHAAMVGRGLAAVDLDALDARLRLRFGQGEQAYDGSEAQAAVARLRALKAAVCGGGGGGSGGGSAEAAEEAEEAAAWRASSLPHEAWEQLEADVQTLSAVAARLRLRDEGRGAGAGGGAGGRAGGEGPVLVTVQDASDLNVARAQQALYERLSQLQR